VLNSNTIYCSVSFVNRIESTEFIKFLKLNVKTSSRRLKPDSCQTHTPPDLLIGATIASFTFIGSRVATSELYLNFPSSYDYISVFSCVYKVCFISGKLESLRVNSPVSIESLS
jgi:hypothetical protein